MTRVRRGGAAAVLLTCLLVLAACTGAPSGDGPAAPAPPEPRDVVASAARSLADAGSARVELSVGAATGAVQASGPMRFTPFATDLTVAFGTRGAQVRAVDDGVWFRLAGAPGWQSLSPGMVPVGAVGGALQAVRGLTDVTERGGEDVGGAPATVYGGTVDLAAARAGADPATAGRLAQLSGLVSPTPRFTAWIGAPDAPEADRGRLLRLSLEPAPPGTAPQPAPAPGAVTIGFAEPGLPVEVSPPA
ncbi:hypothetical protein ACLFMI_03120 [Pseudonocardia nantongensis]|uniref:hypothetical protein n=1 Tax=Pseudonocardia nantongensis TaxID=1181885 RepID=UPI00397810D6